MATNSSAPKRRIPKKQRKGRPAVVDHPNMPRMGEREIAPKRIGQKIVTMPKKPEPDKTKKNVMKPVPKRRTKQIKPGTLGDQVPTRQSVQSDQEGPGYIRLRMRVEDGDLRVKGAKFVPGPLATDEAVSAGLTYEAKIGRRRVAHGDVPDTVEWRSHPDPEGRAGLEGHHIVQQTSYDFTVRIPADQLPKKSLEDLQVTLYRWRGKGPGEHIAINELAKQPKAALDTLATLRGLPMADLTKGLQRDVRRVLDQAGP